MSPPPSTAPLPRALAARRITPPSRELLTIAREGQAFSLMSVQTVAPELNELEQALATLKRLELGTTSCRILICLTAGTKTSGDLALDLQLIPGIISQHLPKLEQLGLVFIDRSNPADRRQVYVSLTQGGLNVIGSIGAILSLAKVSRKLKAA